MLPARPPAGCWRPSAVSVSRLIQIRNTNDEFLMNSSGRTKTTKAGPATGLCNHAFKSVKSIHRRKHCRLELAAELQVRFQAQMGLRRVPARQEKRELVLLAVHKAKAAQIDALTLIGM